VYLAAIGGPKAYGSAGRPGTMIQVAVWTGQASKLGDTWDTLLTRVSQVSLEGSVSGRAAPAPGGRSKGWASNGLGPGWVRRIEFFRPASELSRMLADWYSCRELNI
jgi:hypothetical protein